VSVPVQTMSLKDLPLLSLYDSASVSSFSCFCWVAPSLDLDLLLFLFLGFGFGFGFGLDCFGLENEWTFSLDSYGLFSLHKHHKHPVRVRPVQFQSAHSVSLRYLSCFHFNVRFFFFFWLWSMNCPIMCKSEFISCEMQRERERNRLKS